MPKVTRAKNLANHVALLVDASSSMEELKDKVIEVVDRQVASLAENSNKYNQETRVSIFIFSSKGMFECVVWDMDVLRLPSISKFYEPYGNTALIDSVIKSIDDLSTISQIYGDHSFLLYAWTDGEENNSLARSWTLSDKIKKLPDNWTAAALVPNVRGVTMAEKFGFPPGNIQVWDATSEEGLEKAHQTVLDVNTSYMQARATGMRSTSNLFDMSAAAVNKQTIQAAGLIPLDLSEYILTTVVFDKDRFRDGDDWISTYTTNALGHQYVAGRGYYQLTLAPVKVQVQKDIAIVEKKSGRVYTGKNARALLGLPDMIVTLKAGQNPDYDIFIQSTSPNRKLLHGQKYLYLTPNITYTRGQSTLVVPAKAAPKVAQMPLSLKTVARRAAAAPVAARSGLVVTGVHQPRSGRSQLDLTAPVYPKAGKALWAGIKCPACPSKKTQRCQNNDGSPREKPHPERKV